MNKNVRMQINRDLHAQFKRVDGETNNERMAKLLDDSRDKYALIEESTNRRVVIEYWMRTSNSKDKTARVLASALAVSIAVSMVFLCYVCITNGWLV